MVAPADGDAPGHGRQRAPRAGTCRVPRVVIAAPASGHGKTTVATGLIAAFTRAGRRVAPFKVGPDYIDPGYHALAAGTAGRNLDPFLVGEQRVRDLFVHGSRGAHLAIVEGVMGLYDGAVGRGEFASTAHVARLIGAPVILVVDAAAQGRSVAALVHGFRSFDPALRLAGVILNRVGSDRHHAILAEALDGIGVPVLGSLHRSAAVSAPSRHLGLVPVAERAPESVTVVDALAELVNASIDLAAVERAARDALALPATGWDPAAAVAESMRQAAGSVQAPALTAAPAPAPETSAAPVVAIASGAAFTFCYPEHAELLAAAGAQVVPFDPLRDEKLPDRTRALVIGGGFPEVYAPELAENGALRESVRRFAQDGGTIAAECAGLLYLAHSLDDAPMCGVLPTKATMTGRLTLGYREAVAATDSVLCDAGTRVSGHEFHRTHTEPTASMPPAWLWHERREGASATHEEGFVAAAATGPNGAGRARVHASYLHLHWAGTPSIAARIVREAAAWTP